MKKKTLKDLSANIPAKFIIDGTTRKLSKKDWQIYAQLLLRQDYTTHITDIRFSYLSKLIPSSGKEISRSLKHLEKLGMVNILKNVLLDGDGNTVIAHSYKMRGFKEDVEPHQ